LLLLLLVVLVGARARRPPTRSRAATTAWLSGLLLLWGKDDGRETAARAPRGF
jgi:hypothetical protein